VDGAVSEAGLALLRQLLLFGALLVPLEVLWPARAQGRMRLGLGTDLLYSALSTAVIGTLGVALLAGMSLLCRAILPDALPQALASLPLVTQLGLIVLLAELGGYWTHRLSHTVPALWRFHVVHHSPRELDWLSAHRQHPVEVLWLVGVAHLPVALLGFDTSAIGLFILFQKLHTAFVHANVRLPTGRWEAWIAGPRFHRWHHARDGGAENLASLFPWMDRLFGTWRLPEGEPVMLGVEERVPLGLVGQLLWPVRGLATRLRPWLRSARDAEARTTTS
jgi:sterol desaturase/sphingolipid hydroxylase (fatty acid hydroxylase superfamily)